MAKKMKGGEVLLKITENGLEVIDKRAKKTSQSVGRVGKSAQSADRALKGAAQASSGASKNFSKMSQGITGGLVPAYATLAANLFAVDALFRFLKSSADFRVLTQGQTAFAAATGVAYKSLANDLQAATKNMISFRDAAQAGAIGRAAGLSAGQLTELSEAAFTVSMALGRDVTDSFNRLVRGVTKAEPELLDELGIVLRLEEATTKYAASLNLNKNQLSIYQKSQAVVNEVLDQAERKFGKINEIMEPNANAIAQLGIAAEGAIDTLRPFISMMAEPIAGFFKENVVATITALGLFATSIISSVIPSIGELREKQQLQASAHLEDLDRMQREYDILQKKKQKLARTPIAQKKAVKAMGASTLDKIGGESAKKLKAGDALSNREVGAIKAQITKRSEELGISDAQKKKIFRNLDEIKSKSSVTTQQMKIGFKSFGVQASLAMNKVKTGAIAMFAALERGVQRFTVAMSRLMSALGAIGIAVLAFQMLKGVYDKFFGPDQSQVDQFNARMQKLVGSSKEFNEELTKMVEVRNRGLIVGIADQTLHTAEALQSANLTKTIEQYNLLHSRQSVNAEGFREIANEVSFTFAQLGKLDKGYKDLGKVIQAGNKLNEDQQKTLAALNLKYQEQGAAFKTLKEVEGELIKENNRLVQSLPKVPFQNLISLLNQQKKAFEDLTKGDGGLKEYQADLDLVNGRIELFNALQARQVAIQKDANRLAAASKFSFLAGTSSADLKVSQEENKLLKAKEDLNVSLLNLKEAQQEGDNILVAGIVQQIEAQTDLVKLQEDSVTAAKMQANEIFMTYNALYAGIQNDLGAAIGKGLRGDSSGFDAIGENLKNTLANSIGEGLSKQFLEDIMPKQLQPKTVQEKIREGANYHAQEVRLAIEKGGYYHASQLFNVSKAQVTSLDEITNKILNAEKAVNKRKIKENKDVLGQAKSDSTPATGLFAKRDYELKVSTKQGIADYSETAGFDAASRQFMDAQGFSVKELKSIQQNQQRIKGLRAGTVSANIPFERYELEGARKIRQAEANEDLAQELEKKIEKMYSGSQDAYIEFLEDNTFAAQQKADDFQKQIDQLKRDNKLLVGANTDIDTQLNTEVGMGVSTVEKGAAEKAVDAAKAAAKTKEQEKTETQKSIEQEIANADNFSKNLNQFSGVIGLLGTVTGESEKTGKVMAMAARIQMAVALYQQALQAKEAAKDGVKFFAALFGFGGRQGGIMNPTGYRSYSDGGVAKGPTSGYPAILHGREAVVPLPNGRSIPVDIGKGKMATNNTTITVNMADGSSNVTSDSGAELAKAIDIAVRSTIEKELRPGGILQ